MWLSRKGGASVNNFYACSTSEDVRIQVGCRSGNATVRVAVQVYNDGNQPVSGYITLNNGQIQTFTALAGHSNTMLSFTFSHTVACGIWVTNSVQLTVTSGNNLVASNDSGSCQSGRECPGVPYDPNNKLVYPIRTTEPNGAYGIYESDEALTYTLNFQNTGDWYAQNVEVIDTLDVSKLDLNTIDVITASHDMELMIENNIAHFVFPNIMLPDSHMNEPESHGYVMFSIKRKPNQPVGTVVENFVDIYFDFNVPVRTNTATSIVVAPTSAVDVPVGLAMVLSPNPTRGLAYLDYSLGESGEIVLKVFDMTGSMKYQNSYEQASGAHRLPINTQNWPSGVYMVQLSGNGFSEVSRLIKVD